MARGLSPLQKDILRIFDQSHGALSTGDVMERLEVDLCPQSRPEVVHNSLRRALMRLWERGLLMRTAETIYQDGGRYSHWWAKPTESAIDRHSRPTRPIWFPTAAPFMRPTELSSIADGTLQRRQTGMPSRG